MGLGTAVGGVACRVAYGRIVGSGVGVGWGVKVGGNVAAGSWVGGLETAVLVGGRLTTFGTARTVDVAVCGTAVTALVGKTATVAGRQPLSSQTAVNNHKTSTIKWENVRFMFAYFNLPG